MNRILGVDPGSRITGYGVVEVHADCIIHVASGCIKSTTGDFSKRLQTIFTELLEVIDVHTPDEMAVEKVFVNRNPDSALKLGQARGAAIVAAASRDLGVYEFSATEIKKAIVGRGHADKAQMQHMVKVLLSLRALPQADEADALAAALCHGHTREGLARMRGIGSQRRRG